MRTTRKAVLLYAAALLLLTQWLGPLASKHPVSHTVARTQQALQQHAASRRSSSLDLPAVPAIALSMAAPQPASGDVGPLFAPPVSSHGPEAAFARGPPLS